MGIILFPRIYFNAKASQIINTFVMILLHEHYKKYFFAKIRKAQEGISKWKNVSQFEKFRLVNIYDSIRMTLPSKESLEFIAC
jgi:hypothetical protein